MHVLIDARFKDGGPGGIQQVVMGIAYGFSQLENCMNLRLTFLMLEGHTDWLEVLLPENAEIKCVPCHDTDRNQNALNGFKNWGVRKFGHFLGKRSVSVQVEPEIVKEINPDLIHFVHQNIFKTDKPFIFMPMDLQHEYYPENFTKRTVMVRRFLYQQHAERAASVVCISNSCKRDVVHFLGIPDEKCSVVHCAPAIDIVGCVRDTQNTVVEKTSQLPEKYLIYPARYYAHKNHLNLIRAVKHAKDNKKIINVVCSGSETKYFRKYVYPEVLRLGLQEQIFFMGWVSPDELSVLYEKSSGLVFPSYFEGFGMPLVEAMRAGLPIACSDKSCIPEIVGSAGIYFNPDRPKEIANSMIQLLENSKLRKDLLIQSVQQVKSFSWVQSAENIYDIYKHLLRT